MDNRLKLGVKGQQGYAAQLQGQAGVYAVASKLCLLGHVPFFPGVDYGYDLVIENGIKLQVKAAYASLASDKRDMYPWPSYRFDMRVSKPNAHGKMERMNRHYRKVADFFVLWGIDENRFWIVPTSEIKGATVLFTRGKRYGSDRYIKQRTQKARWEDDWKSLDLDAAIEKLAVTVPAPGEYYITAEIAPKEKS
jgi:hypothetical protein